MKIRIGPEWVSYISIVITHKTPVHIVVFVNHRLASFRVPMVAVASAFWWWDVYSLEFFSNKLLKEIHLKRLKPNWHVCSPDTCLRLSSKASTWPRGIKGRYMNSLAVAFMITGKKKKENCSSFVPFIFRIMCSQMWIKLYWLKQKFTEGERTRDVYQFRNVVSSFLWFLGNLDDATSCWMYDFWDTTQLSECSGTKHTTIKL